MSMCSKDSFPTYNNVGGNCHVYVDMSCGAYIEMFHLSVYMYIHTYICVHVASTEATVD